MRDEAIDPRPGICRISRRKALKSIAGIAAAGALGPSLAGLGQEGAAPVRSTGPVNLINSINPKWYGFNLLEYFSTDADWMKYFPYKNDGNFQEDDFRWMRDWGFNWVRLPMDYRFWTDPKDLLKINEKMILPIDRAIRLGEKYAVHVNISLHRAPGYCCLDGNDASQSGIHVTPEKTNLFTDQATLDAFVNQWTYFAARYKGISSEKLSFNLVNEPSVYVDGKYVQDGMKQYARVARAAIAGIRGKDASRLIVTDGDNGPGWGHLPIPELFDTGIVQSCHDYWPVRLTHCLTKWATYPGSDQTPAWPVRDALGVVGKREVEEEFLPWRGLAGRAVPIHFGEMGCNRYTPPKVLYGWLNDSLDMIGSMQAGWGLWNFRGPYGVLDTGRAGTDYKDWHGHKLDAALLKLLKSKMKV